LKSFLRKLSWVIGLAGVGLVALFAGLKVYLDSTYFRGYQPSAPFNIEIVEDRETPAGRRIKFYYDGFKGERVPAVMVRPALASGRLPCVVFLHGIGNDKEFMARHQLDEPFVRAGFAFVCFDQLTRGERKLKESSGWSKAAAFRVRAAHTVNDTRRLLDYLSTRTDIAPSRMYLCGASYGAMTGTVATALDERIQAAVLIYGGGDLRKLLSADMVRREMGPRFLPAYLAAWYFGSVFDPVRYAARISPRPILFQNGKADTVVPPAAARALYDAAREPKRILWYEGDHLGKNRDLDVTTAQQVLTDAIRFLQRVDKP